MTLSKPGDAVERPAASPNADIACDTSIAVTLREEGVHERLLRSVVRPIETLPDGVRVTFTAASWDAVNRYIDVESQCCPFLDLAAELRPETVVLTVTGRPESQELIRRIFTSSRAPNG